MSDFKPFGRAVADRFHDMSKTPSGLFVVDIDGDKLWEMYQAAFPAGTNPIFRKRAEHDCACCHNFVRNVGNVVDVVDGKRKSLWELDGLESPYLEVAAALDEAIKAAPIVEAFYSEMPSYGAETSRELREGAVHTWDHFHCTIHKNHRADRDTSAAKLKGTARTQVQMLERLCKEVDLNSIKTVKELIEAKSLYRGEENLPALAAITVLVADYAALSAKKRNTFLWTHRTKAPPSFVNTSFGTLLCDLSAGMDTEEAVKKYEAIVAGPDYNRPTAIVTPTMIKKAMEKITEDGLEPAIYRRFAKLSDVSVNNVLWVDRSVRGKMKDGLEGLLLAETKQVVKADSEATLISIEDFMSKIVPNAVSMELVVSNEHTGNMVSLTAPINSDVKPLFKWDNNFAWSYNGNVTDSIKERVKKAGGNVIDAELRISLSWSNHDDLDLHVLEPGGHEICYYAKQGRHGILDVDMNMSATTREPVENVAFKRAPHRMYGVTVHQYRKREDKDVGFELEVEYKGKVTTFSHAKALLSIANCFIVSVDGKTAEFSKVNSALVKQSASREVWGVKTGTYTPVSALMYSPNYWDDNATGNKHWFFILEGCTNPEEARGIYNEFLRSDLHEHRKAFELIGAKTKCQLADEQLSGVGFSSTKAATVMVKVTSQKATRIYNVNF